MIAIDENNMIQNNDSGGTFIVADELPGSCSRSVRGVTPLSVDDIVRFKEATFVVVVSIVVVLAAAVDTSCVVAGCAVVFVVLLIVVVVVEALVCS